MYRNFILFMWVLGSGRQKIPLPPPVPLRRGIKGEDRGCKIAPKNTTPSIVRLSSRRSPTFLRVINSTLRKFKVAVVVQTLVRIGCKGTEDRATLKKLPQT